MLFGRFWPVLLCLNLLYWAPVGVNQRTWAFQADNTSLERERKFLQGLRERGYFDLAADYLQGRLAATDLPAELKAAFSYELGRGLIEEAATAADLDRRLAILEQARNRLTAFTTENPNHPLVPEAQVQLARLLIEKGHTALLQANEVKTEDDQGKPIPSAKTQREARLTTARGFFAEARKAYDQAHTRLKADFEAFPKFIAETDPRRVERERAHTALMNQELQRAIADYEEAQTYPTGSKDRDRVLDEASKQFKDLADRYRTQMTGPYAQMLRAKCYEEKGELGPAMADYDELMKHTDAALKPLQMKVGYYRIIIMGKRKEYPLAVDEAARWLTTFSAQRSSEEGLGVQLEQAKNLLAQVPEMAGDPEREQATRNAVERLTEVVRYYSPHKPEALALLQQNQSKVSKKNVQVANLSYDDAMDQADTAMSSNDWSTAESLLKQAIRKATQARDVEKLNRSRYFLAYVKYATERYYESAALADHLARRYPEGAFSVRAAELGLASMTQAYNKFTEVDRQSDLDRLTDLGSYTIKTWPDSEQADNSRLTLGEIALGRGQFTEAATWLEGLRESSPKRQDALVKAGDAHWRLSRKLRDQGDTAGADREAQAAFNLVQGALKNREAANIPLADVGRLSNINALAEIHRASGRQAEAIALLAPVAQSLETAPASPELAPVYSAGLSILLRSYLASGEPTKATSVMSALEKVSPSGTALTQLYYELGRSLKTELDTQKGSNNTEAYKKTLEAYQQFLQALAASQVGQSFDSLLWAGESMLDLKMAKPAADILDKAIQTYAQDESFLKQEGSANQLLRARLKLIGALRQSGQNGDLKRARTLVDELLKSNSKVLELNMEQGLVLEEQARKSPGAQDQLNLWQESLTQWQKLAKQLQNSKQRKLEGYEAWYHVAVAQEGIGKKQEALRTLKGILTVTPSVGSPEMKKKYEDLVKRLGG